MITYFDYDKDCKELIINATKDGVDKTYRIRENYFLSTDVTYSISVELDSSNIEYIRRDSLYVASMLDELREIDNVDVILAILNMYLRGVSIEDTNTKIMEIIKA